MNQINRTKICEQQNTQKNTKKISVIREIRWQKKETTNNTNSTND